MAPFDRIIVTCAAPHIPNKLLSQVAIGGLIVIPIDSLDREENYGKQRQREQNMTVIERISKNEYKRSVHSKVSFVSMLPGVEQINKI